MFSATRTTVLQLCVATLLYLYCACAGNHSTVMNKTTASHDEQSNGVQAIDQNLPFELRAFETMLKAAPDNPALLLETAIALVRFGHQVVSEQESLRTAQKVDLGERHATAKALFLRARDYSLEAMEARHPGFRKVLARNEKDAVTLIRAEEAPALFYAALAHISTFTVGQRDSAVILWLPVAETFLECAIGLDSVLNRPVVQQMTQELKSVREMFRNGRTQVSFGSDWMVPSGRQKTSHQVKVGELRRLLEQACTISVRPSGARVPQARKITLPPSRSNDESATVATGLP